ncbi:RloB family protein [Lactococcus lactis]|uniref:RloB family protein n=1 Tax=Lactococcus lactis TaxID=1358 RepID=UPI0024A61E3F|nr:RloB family protein [Lactococcus lactis]
MARRASQNLKLKPTIVIFTEGITEAIYFERLNQVCNTKIRVRPITQTRQGLDLIYNAKKQIKEKNGKLGGFKIERVYICFDYDEITDEELKSCKDLADSLDYKLIFSNRSIEVWLLLHFEHITGPLSQDQLILKLTKHLKQPYDKTSRKQIEKIIDNLSNAINNSSNMCEDIVFDSNPYTNFRWAIKEIYRI